MVDFAGWEMPVQYTGVRDEHEAVRTKCGIFDVSHMGELEVRGPKAEELVQRVTCNDVSRLKSGDCQYSAFLTPNGTFIDDIIVNRLGAEHFLICVNASNIEKDFDWVRSFAIPDATVENRSDDYFQIAFQGPQAEGLVGAMLSEAAPPWGASPLPAKPFTLVQTQIAGCPVIVSRTGYTGEDGFEIYGAPQDVEKVWLPLMDRGARPCGLGARDTLRLEAAYPLYGHEIDDTIHPFEARLGWILKMDKGDFIGRDALLKKKIEKRLIGIEMTEPGIARQGCRIFHGEKEIGWVTSCTMSPTLDRAIALGYVGLDFSADGTKIEVDIHNKKRHAITVSLPFYKRILKP